MKKEDKMNIFKSKKIGFVDLLYIPFCLKPILFCIKMLDVLVYAALPSIQAIFTAQFVDLCIEYFDKKQFTYRLEIVFMGLIFCIALTYLNDCLMVYIDQGIEMAIITNYQRMTIQKRSKLLYKYIEDSESMDLLSRICTNIDENKFLQGYRNFIKVISTLITVFSLLWLVSSQVWWLGGAICLVAIPLFLLSMKVGKNAYEENKEGDKAKREAIYLQKVLREREYVEERSLFEYTDFVDELWYKSYEKARKISQRTDVRYWIKIKGAGIVTAILAIIILTILLIPLYQNEISVGMFMSLSVAFVELINSISWNLMDMTKELAACKSYLNEFNKFLNLEETKEDKYALDITTKELQTIVFSHVSFKYPGTDTYILKNFSLKIEKGKKYAIVGKNGAGKTTLIKLLLKLYDYEGQIFINGKELRKIPNCNLRELFSVVFQDFVKYNLSFKENIMMGRNKYIPKEMVHSMIGKMGLKDVVSRLKSGMNTQLGKLEKDSEDLSGGEWQRVGILRSILREAPICILDEPTASIDPVSESKMYKLFSNLSDGKTMLMITHRLGATKIADVIVVVENGVAQEIGTHKELMRQNGLYKKMYNTQRGWYE